MASSASPALQYGSKAQLMVRHRVSAEAEAVEQQSNVIAPSAEVKPAKPAVKPRPSCKSSQDPAGPAGQPLQGSAVGQEQGTANKRYHSQS